MTCSIQQSPFAVQGSLLQCQAVAQRRGLSHQYYASANELHESYPMNAKEHYQGLFEHGAGSIKVVPVAFELVVLPKAAPHSKGRCLCLLVFYQELTHLLYTSSLTFHAAVQHDWALPHRHWAHPCKAAGADHVLYL